MISAVRSRSEASACDLTTSDLAQMWGGCSLRQLQLWDEEKIVLASMWGRNRRYSRIDALVLGLIQRMRQIKWMRPGQAPGKARHLLWTHDELRALSRQLYARFRRDIPRYLIYHLNGEVDFTSSSTALVDLIVDDLRGVVVLDIEPMWELLH